MKPVVKDKLGKSSRIEDGLSVGYNPRPYKPNTTTGPQNSMTARTYTTAPRRLDVRRLMVENFDSAEDYRTEFGLTVPDAQVPTPAAVAKWERRRSIPTSHLLIMALMCKARGRVLDIAAYVAPE